jgi:hypothetical protein
MTTQQFLAAICFACAIVALLALVFAAGVWL